MCGGLIDKRNADGDHIGTSWSAEHGKVWNHCPAIGPGSQETGGVSVRPGWQWLMWGSLVEQWGRRQGSPWGQGEGGVNIRGWHWGGLL